MSQELVCPECGHTWSARTSVDTRKRTKCPACGLYATSTRFVPQKEPEEPEAPEPEKAPSGANEGFISFSDIEFETTAEERASKTEDDIEIEDEQATQPSGPAPIDPATYNPILLEIIDISMQALGVELTEGERSRLKSRATNLELRYQAMQTFANNNVMVWLLFFICVASILVPKIIAKFKAPKKDENEGEKKEVRVDWKQVPSQATPPPQPASQPGAFDTSGLYKK